MRVDVKLTQTDDQIAKLMLNIWIKKVDHILKNIKTEVQTHLRQYIIDEIYSSSTYQDLVSESVLRSEIGLVSGRPKIDNLIEDLVETISIILTPAIMVGGNKLQGKIKVAGVRSVDLLGVLNNDYAVYRYLSKRYDRVLTIPWLKWILTEGDKILDFRVSYGHPVQSRTGDAIMVPDKGSMWTVPAEHAGTIDDNFITRAMHSTNIKLQQLFLKELKKYGS